MANGIMALEKRTADTGEEIVNFFMVFTITPAIVNGDTQVPTPATVDGRSVLHPIVQKSLDPAILAELDAGTSRYEVVELVIPPPVDQQAIAAKAKEIWDAAYRAGLPDQDAERWKYAGSYRAVTPPTR